MRYKIINYIKNFYVLFLQQSKYRKQYAKPFVKKWWIIKVRELYQNMTNKYQNSTSKNDKCKIKITKLRGIRLTSSRTVTVPISHKILCFLWEEHWRNDNNLKHGLKRVLLKYWNCFCWFACQSFSKIIIWIVMAGYMVEWHKI